MGTSNDRTPVECSVQIIRTTEKAFLVTDGTTEPNKQGKSKAKTFWLPKSQCTWPDNADMDIEDHDPNTVYTVQLPMWLATEKGLI